MLAFILRRFGQAILVMLTVELIAFSLFRFVGDPVVYMGGQDATEAQRVPVMAAYLCLVAAFFVIINLVVDLLYYAVDPRLRIEPT